MHKTIHELQEEAKKAAGEILERFNLVRKQHIDRGVIRNLKRDMHGDAIES
jgi:hypothetical protein